MIDELFPAGRVIAEDDFGNATVREGDVVWFVCHDPPVVLVGDIADDDRFDVWGTDPGVLDHAGASAGDPVLAGFAAELGDAYDFIDLRDAPEGMGFAWGRYGPETEVCRCGAEPIFARRIPQRRGLLRRRR